MTTAFWIGLLWLALGLIFAAGDTPTAYVLFAYGASVFFFGVHHITRAIERSKK